MIQSMIKKVKKKRSKLFSNDTDLLEEISGNSWLFKNDTLGYYKNKGIIDIF